ncbi:MAG TPA: DMT family transporter [Gemmatimonadales bacterium]|nr:DMT family transporter [Gemmatimonadales bacterium]
MNPRLQVALAAMLFSTGGAAIKLSALSGWGVLAGRAAVAALTILLLVPDARRHWNGRALLVALAYAATTTLYVQANKLTTAASTIFLQSTSPLFILLLAPLLLGERASRRDLGSMLVLAAGMVLLFAGTPRRFATAPNPLAGNVLAAACAVTWALTLLGYRWIAARGGSVASAATMGNLLACGVGLSAGGGFPSGSALDWLVLGYLGVFQLGLSYVLLTRAVPRLPALEVSLVLLVEPVLNPIWAWLVHGETVSRWALLGGAIILGATLHRAWREARGLTTPAATVRGRLPAEEA